jgi:hypothetical protein
MGRISAIFLLYRKDTYEWNPDSAGAAMTAQPAALTHIGVTALFIFWRW